MNIEEDMSAKLRELRDLLNGSAITKSKTWGNKDEGAWSKLWSAFDNIEDTQAAIDEFIKGGTGRLGIYGLLQAMVVQQDAIMHLEQALDLEVTKLSTIPSAQVIRDVRDETIGHPTSTRRNKDKSSYTDGTISYTSISADTSNSKQLEYVVWSKNGNQIKRIDLSQAIKDQEKAFVDVIKLVFKKVQNIEKEHKEKFKSDSLEILFNQYSYYIQKLWPFEKNREHSKVCLGSISQAYNKFKEGVKARFGEDVFSGEGFRPGLFLEIDKLDKVLPRIEKMILMKDGVDELDLEVYIESLDNSLGELKKMAEEIDAEFGYSIASKEGSK